MRKVKFRAWNKKLKIMCYDNEDDSSDYWDGVDSSIVGLINYRLSRKDEYKFMQFTGFKGTGKKEIYESDIVSYKVLGYSNECKGEVQFENGNWIIKGFITTDMNLAFMLKVLGNIYDNPELLEVTPCKQ